MVIQPLSTHLIKPNFCFHLFQQCSTTVSLETRSPFSNDCCKNQYQNNYCTLTNLNKSKQHCYLLKVGKKSHTQSATGLDFASRWLKNWCTIFKPIPKHRNRNCMITFNSHLVISKLLSSQNQGYSRSILARMTHVILFPIVSRAK